MISKLKRLYISNGKFTLDDKFVDVDVLRLDVLRVLLPIMEVCRTQDKYQSEIDRRFEKGLRDHRPERADSYCIGNSVYGTPGAGCNCLNYPVAYLRINPKPNRRKK